MSRLVKKVEAKGGGTKKNILAVARETYNKYVQSGKHCLNQSCSDYEIQKCFPAGARNPELAGAGVKICTRVIAKGRQVVPYITFEKSPVAGVIDPDVSVELKRDVPIASSAEDTFVSGAMFAKDMLAGQGIQFVADAFASMANKKAKPPYTSRKVAKIDELHDSVDSLLGKSQNAIKKARAGNQQ